MTSLTGAVLTVIAAKQYDHRTVVPGVVDQPQRKADREQDVDFNPGIGDLVAQEPAPAQVSASAPMLTIAGGGFYMLLPIAAGDETLGLVSDRSLGIWRENRTPGAVDKLTGRRTGNLSDVMLAPFAITAPEGAPDTWDGMALGGPAGLAIELAEGGELTLTKQGVTIATITMDAAGSITFEVQPGQSVNVGGPAAVELTKVQALQAFLASAATTAAGAAVELDGGAAAFTSFATTLAGLAAAAGTTIAKGI